MIGKFIASLLLTGILVVSARAETDAVESPLSIRGFGTVGLARSSSDHAEFVRDLSQPVGIKGGKWSGRIDSILGLQANWRATQDLEFVGQVVSRLHYDRSHNPEVMWAFAKWEPDTRYSFRAGRIGADFMMLADSRLVGYSYLTVRPPTDFFGPLFFSHFDGVDASGTVPIGNGLVRGKVFVGKTGEKSVGGLGIWDTRGSPVRGLVFDYVTGPWHLRFNSAQIRFANNMNTAFLTDQLYANGAEAAADSLRAKDTLSRFLSIGAVYDNGPLQVQAMANRIRHDTALLHNSHAGFLQASYRVGSFTPYAGLSIWKTQPRTGLVTVPDPYLNAAYQEFVAYPKIDRKTFSLGARWDFNRQMALKFQWDVVRASKDTYFTFPHADSARWNGKTDVLTATMDFVF